MPNSKEEIFTHMFALGKIVRAKLDKSGLLPLGQLETLRYIAGHDGAAMHDIARYHNVTAPSATAHVEELVRARYLRRTADRSDRRAVRLEITPSGKSALKRNMNRRQRIVEDVLRNLSKNDRAALNRILGKIISTHNA
jgi:DNA-binding MarR family transcriptional regulator